MAASRPPITCHVLDTTSGRPAAGIAVTLTLVSTTGGSAVGTGSFYAGTTDGDGRVTEWAAAGGAALADVFAKLREEGGGAAGPSSWALRFETGPYYDAKGVEPFYPEVELRFVVRRPEEHFHVPLLLGPYSYTTYRGS
ncbi:transthyretin-like protein-like protein [Lineolata rhizophorae]|uniref:5-hydroxyisourate hydrolase n=1 Tax=Lineolata rhizophorae TaxID=578093 RepID=A0A6A6P470_9PEZI|nr:transthyretin-like protein-like protein [Lineolata rhizophorae]